MNISLFENYHNAARDFPYFDGDMRNLHYFSHFHREAELARLMLSQSASKIIVADSSKVGRTAFVNIAETNSADYLITDDNQGQPDELNILKKSIRKIIIVKE